MKIITVAVLLIFTSQSQGLIFNCEFKFSDEYLINMGSIYGCTIGTEITGGLSLIEEVRGNHLSGKSNANVEGLYEVSVKLLFIPSNLANFFPSLKSLRIFSPLIRITANDLKPFPNLLVFQSSHGKFENIDGDLFQHTKKIQQIYFYWDGKLKNDNENFLNGLDALTQVWFDNTDMQVFADTPQKVEELKQKISEITKPRCFVRCSLGEEFDEVQLKSEEKNAKLNGEIAMLLKQNIAMHAVIYKQGNQLEEQVQLINELRENNAQQDNRLYEVEKMIREIAATP